MKLAQSKVHFIGIGGVGMCGLAELLHNLGAEVTGSDQSQNALTVRLTDVGIKVYHEHEASHVHGVDVVVYSSAVKPTNVEYVEALKNKIPLIRRAEALAELMRLKRGIAVAGTHGKTTTTSMISSILIQKGMDPTIVVGGRLEWIKSTAQLGKGEWLVAEADESDGSFNRLSPEIIIITNIDSDHLDHYGSFRQLQMAFVDFASRIPFYGTVILCGDDPDTRELFKGFGKRLITYGFDESNQYRLNETAKSGVWRVTFGDSESFEFRSPMPGKHNAKNSLAAILASHLAGLDFTTAADGVSGFQGVDRRFQHKASVRKVDFYDDYGHHPTEVAAVLQGFKEKYPDRRLITIFQPHRYSRTQLCWDEFLNAFAQTDELYLLDIYPAGESAIEDITSERLAREIKHPQAKMLSRDDASLEKFIAGFRPSDVILTLGAGDVFKLNTILSQSFLKMGSR